MTDILVSRFAFISGLKTKDGHPIMTFPDSRTYIDFEQYQLLIGYLLQVPPLEEDHSSKRSYVIIVDRRLDKWSSVRLLFTYLTNYFPESIRVVFLLKPEGVLQRALEVGYRNFAENGKFKVVVCQNSVELRHFIGGDSLTMDVGGDLKYNHLEWVQHRMDIERMKSSAAVIAESLSEFGRCLRETELPNDVETTERVLEAQTAEHDAIKEDFRISIRKGLSLLRQVRQLEHKPDSELLSPTRLHNVTAIERMLVQLEDTEKSFDAFWARHRQRLTNCLQLRRFEESFRKLQSCFAKHMIYLEEHRDVGDSVRRAEELAAEHEEYAINAMGDVQMARTLREKGEELIAMQDVELSDSLLPKCEELSRMADALTSALDRRTQVLLLSRNMHDQIAQANSWCRRGVDLLSGVPLELTSSVASSAMNVLDDFLVEGEQLQLDALKPTPNMNNLILLTTTETSSLLAQVAERIDDIRRMGIARRDALQRVSERQKGVTSPTAGNLTGKPIQVVSPEKKARGSVSSSASSSASSPTGSVKTSEKRQIEVLHEFQQCSSVSIEGNPSVVATPSRSPSMDSSITARVLSNTGNGSPAVKAKYVIEELLSTEQTYVRELREVVEYYVKPFEAAENLALFPPALRGQSEIVFGNIRELLDFHNRHILSELLTASDSIVDICHILISKRNRFLNLYRPYCQNKPLSEALRAEHVEGNKFFLDCQKRAGHLLPLSSYLLKPIQRITKYQLLLKELLRYCPEDARHDVQAALAAMLDLLSQLNADLHQLHISAFVGDLRLLGPLRLQTECDVYVFKKKTHRLTNKAQKRYLFLFDGGVLFCKKRTQPVPYAPEYYEHKMCIPMQNLGYAECSRSAAERFEIWDETKPDGYAIHPVDESAKAKWISKLTRSTKSFINGEKQSSSGVSASSRPQSWTSESTVSSRSSGSAFEDMTASTASTSSATQGSDTLIDPNGNNNNNVDLSQMRRKSSSTISSYSDLDNRCGSAHVTTIQVQPKTSSNHGDLDSIALPTNTSNYSLNAIIESKSQNELIAK